MSTFASVMAKIVHPPQLVQTLGQVVSALGSRDAPSLCQCCGLQLLLSSPIPQLVLSQNWTERGGRRMRLCCRSSGSSESGAVGFGASRKRSSRSWLDGHRFLICDRDRKWTLAVRDLLETSGVRMIQAPFHAPNCNAHAERFVRSVKEECDRMIPLGGQHLRQALVRSP